MTTDTSPDAHYTKNTDNVSFTTVLLALPLRRKVKNQIEANSIGMIECLGGEIFTRRRKEDSYFGEFLIDGLLYIVVISAATDTAGLDSYCLL